MATGTSLRALWIALAFVVCSCGPDASADSWCSVESALYNGSTDPAPLDLTLEQRNAIVTLESAANTPLCTGVLLSNQLVLSAAHCARTGTVNVRVNHRFVATRNIVRHPEFDAMLVELVAADVAGDVTPIAPWPSDVDQSWIAIHATLAGRGVTESGQIGELRFAHEPIVDVRPSEIWVDGGGKTGACGGDSGGPLLVADAANQARIAGVLDRGSNDCVGLDVYTRIDRLAAWIDDTIGRDRAPAGSGRCL